MTHRICKKCGEMEHTDFMTRIDDDYECTEDCQVLPDVVENYLCENLAGRDTKSLAFDALLKESIERDKQLAKLEAEVIVLRNALKEQNIATSQEVPSVQDDPEVERERELDRQMKLHDVYPTIVCQKCGLAALALPENSHKKQFKVSTWYPLLCECCGKKKSCTESRDFGYPDFRNVKS